jgi:hypothetical protein
MGRGQRFHLGLGARNGLVRRRSRTYGCRVPGTSSPRSMRRCGRSCAPGVQRLRSWRPRAPPGAVTGPSAPTTTKTPGRPLITSVWPRELSAPLPRSRPIGRQPAPRALPKLCSRACSRCTSAEGLPFTSFSTSRPISGPTFTKTLICSNSRRQPHRRRPIAAPSCIRTDKC